MELTTFIVVLAALAGAYLWWGMKKLPHESWQIAAAVPIGKGEDGHWRGVNLTWYGILTANAYVVAVLLALVLMSSVGIALRSILLMVALLLIFCVPASRIVAQLVEGKRNTFTVGGAVFIGTLLSPWTVELVNRIDLGAGPRQTPVLPALAAFAIAYAFGEGLGRLACVSFGCCYGKPLSSCHPLVAGLASPFAFVFSGKTKKISYASGLEGVKVLPVQAMTYLLYTATGIISLVFFFNSYYGAAFVTALGVTQGWRILSEFLRDDYRGGGRLSAYQIMGVLATIYGIWVSHRYSDQTVVPELSKGLAGLWDPSVLLAFQLIWVAILLYTGLSRVTGATMTFHVNADKI